MGQTQVPPAALLDRYAALNRLAASALLLRFNLEHRLALVRAAIGACVMGPTHGTTLRAADEVHRGQGIVSPAPVTATLGQLTLWMRWH
jgi:hypothetical protein